MGVVSFCSKRFVVHVNPGSPDSRLAPCQTSCSGYFACFPYGHSAGTNSDAANAEIGDPGFSYLLQIEIAPTCYGTE